MFPLLIHLWSKQKYKVIYFHLFWDFIVITLKSIQMHKKCANKWKLLTETLWSPPQPGFESDFQTSVLPFTTFLYYLKISLLSLEGGCRLLTSSPSRIFWIGTESLVTPSPTQLFLFVPLPFAYPTSESSCDKCEAYRSRDSKHGPLICKPVCYRLHHVWHFFYFFIILSILRRCMPSPCNFQHTVWRET